MTDRKGFFWHVHHSGLILEWCHSYDERTEYIRANKPEDEEDIRLRLFKPVLGKLPDGVVIAGRALAIAEEVAYEKRKTQNNAELVKYSALQVYNKALQDHHEAMGLAACSEAHQICNTTWQNYKRLDQAYNEASRVYYESVRNNNRLEQNYLGVIEKNMPKIEKLHKVECPNCLWDGKTIFPKS